MGSEQESIFKSNLPGDRSTQMDAGLPTPDWDEIVGMTTGELPKPVINRAGTLLDSSQQRRRYVDTPLGATLVKRGLTATRLASISGTSRADVSHFLHGRRAKIGAKRTARIDEALLELVIEHAWSAPMPVCRNCGIEFPLGIAK